MKRIFFISFLAIGTLAACGQEPSSHANEALPANVKAVDTMELRINDYHRVTKFCDGSRAVYVHTEYSDPGGIAIVENAEECKNNS